MKLLELINQYFNDENCFILLYTKEKVLVGEYTNGILVNIENIEIDSLVNEFHIFNEKQEVKQVYGKIYIKEDSNNQFIDEAMFINNNFTKTYSKVVVRNYYSYNEDNIIYIDSSRLVRLEVK